MSEEPRRLAQLQSGAGEEDRSEIRALHEASQTRFTRSKRGSGTLGARFSAAWLNSASPKGKAGSRAQRERR